MNNNHILGCREIADIKNKLKVMIQNLSKKIYYSYLEHLNREELEMMFIFIELLKKNKKTSLAIKETIVYNIREYVREERKVSKITGQSSLFKIPTTQNFLHELINQLTKKELLKKEIKYKLYGSKKKNLEYYDDIDKKHQKDKFKKIPYHSYSLNKVYFEQRNINFDLFSLILLLKFSGKDETEFFFQNYKNKTVHTLRCLLDSMINELGITKDAFIHIYSTKEINESIKKINITKNRIDKKRLKKQKPLHGEVVFNDYIHL